MFLGQDGWRGSEIGQSVLRVLYALYGWLMIHEGERLRGAFPVDAPLQSASLGSVVFVRSSRFATGSTSRWHAQFGGRTIRFRNRPIATLPVINSAGFIFGWIVSVEGVMVPGTGNRWDPR